MLKKDNLYFGILLAIILPICVGLLLYGLNQWYFSQKQNLLFKDSGLFLVSVTSNLVPFLFYSSSSFYNETTKGILLMTFLGAIIFIIKFFLLN